MNLDLGLVNKLVNLSDQVGIMGGLQEKVHQAQMYAGVWQVLDSRF